MENCKHRWLETNGYVVCKECGLVDEDRIVFYNGVEHDNDRLFRFCNIEQKDFKANPSYEKKQKDERNSNYRQELMNLLEDENQVSIVMQEYNLLFKTKRLRISVGLLVALAAKFGYTHPKMLLWIKNNPRTYSRNVKRLKFL